MNKELATGNREPKPATGDREPEPGSGNQEPKTEQGIGNRQPSAGNWEPGAGNWDSEPGAWTEINFQERSWISGNGLGISRSFQEQSGMLILLNWNWN